MPQEGHRSSRHREKTEQPFDIFFRERSIPDDLKDDFEETLWYKNARRTFLAACFILLSEVMNLALSPFGFCSVASEAAFFSPTIALLLVAVLYIPAVTAILCKKITSLFLIKVICRSFWLLTAIAMFFFILAELTARGTVYNFYFFLMGYAIVALEPPTEILVVYIFETLSLIIYVIAYGYPTDNLHTLIVIGACAVMVSVYFHNLEIRFFLRQKKLESLAEKDELTRVYNRRGLFKYGEILYRRCLRSRQSVTVIALDVDLFKNYNDSYGHLAGDRCLIRFADTLRSFARRPDDIVARVGGEEFTMILEGISKENSLALALKLCSAIPQTTGIGKDPAVTASIGLAYFENLSATRDFEYILRVADDELYNAKRSGRYCVSFIGKIHH